jgi:hypothetical protein
MLRAFRLTRNKSIRGTVAGFAMAIALAGGVAMGSTAVTSEAAYAQNSRGFAEAYSPVAEMMQPETANFEGARAAIPTVIAAIENENDRQVAGNLILNIGNNLSDPALQRQGLQMMLDSGLVAPEQVDYIMQAVADTEAAGTAPRESWLLSTLQKTYDFEMAEESVAVSQALIRNYPTQQNWVNGLQVVNALYEFEPAVRVDMYRLMRATDSLTQRPEFVRYIEDLDPRVMANEVQVILANGMQAGVFTADDPYYVEVKEIADTRAPQDRSGIEGIVSDGETGDAIDAMSTGDVLYSLNDFVRAETMYRLAMEKGADANTANTRIGIAQTEQGNYAAAVETFSMVTGTHSPIARMWAAYAATMM